VTSEVHGIQGDLYDARTDAYYAATGTPEPETGWWEVEAGS
jgi:hypothetical protein